MNKKSDTVLENVYRLLKEGIKEGKYAPGQRLVEVDLIKEFEIGRSTVRELLRRLAGDRLVDYAPHQSAIVRSLSRAEVDDIYLLRAHLEGLAARLAAKNIDRPGNRKKLQAITKDFKKATRKSNVSDYLKHNERFHALIVELSGSDAMPDLCQRLVVPTFRLQFAQHIRQDTTEDALGEHERIVAAILNGDEDKAEKELKRHLRLAGKMIQQLPDTAFRKDPAS
jgi:DNA-binding GntR family transcriptional regulator